MVLLMLASILFNWLIGRIIDIANNEWHTKGIKSFALILGIIVNLSALGYYKYASFLASSINKVFGQTLFPVAEIALPIGISFFTFQAMSYIIDVYRGTVSASRSIVDVALYISFFPQLIAGPIVQYKDIHQQLKERTVSWEKTSNGFKRFIYGLGKKVLIANILGLCVDTIYSYRIIEIDAKTAWIGALAYFFQIYYDFSGYSDMAIGLGEMFGFTLPENFHCPYLSKSITEFWRNWHISLGSWFREYVYIPLGGSRKGNVRTIVNLGIVFLLTGVWHGAGLSFIIWGLYHGVFVIVERLVLKKYLSKLRIVSVIYTDFVVLIGWVLFRAETTLTGFRFIARMLLPWRHLGINIPAAYYMDSKTLLAFIAGVIGMGMLKKLPKPVLDSWRGSVVEAVYCTLILVLSVAAIASNTYNPFIYFQF